MRPAIWGSAFLSRIWRLEEGGGGSCYGSRIRKVEKRGRNNKNNDRLLLNHREASYFYDLIVE